MSMKLRIGCDSVEIVMEFVMLLGKNHCERRCSVCRPFHSCMSEVTRSTGAVSVMLQEQLAVVVREPVPSHAARGVPYAA